MKKLFLFSVFILLNISVWATKYYVHPQIGSDLNTGTKKNAPIKSLEKVNELELKAGDQVLLASGCIFVGELILQNISGTCERPIIVSSYQPRENSSSAKPIINAKGYLNGILINNCSYIIVKDIEITANGQGSSNVTSQEKQMRCGVLVCTSKPGLYSNITLSKLLVHNVFFEEKGFKRGAAEVKTANGRQNYGWGIRFINATDNATLERMIVMDCMIQNVAHTGLKFTGKDKSIHDIKVLNNQVKYTGGPGIQMSGVHGGHVKDNAVNFSGSNNDSRKWGRGSGLWTWGTSDVIIEHNSFKNANGPGDSAGCHIDYNCNNVIVQYNLSANNAGGFCEILGNNYNCAYRYNISVNDGFRIKGENGAFQEGKVFWLSGYQGNKKRSGPFNSYIYNNTIYLKKGIVAKIAIDNASEGILIANNIFYFEGESKAVLGDQYRPEKAGVSRVRNIVFKNNLYLNSDNWPSDVLIQDEEPLVGDPGFIRPGGEQLLGYLPTNKELVKNKGIKIHAVPKDSIGLYIGLDVKYDIMGNKINGSPDMGAIEIK